MPERAWSAKRERQYEHIKDGLRERGEPDDNRGGDRGAHREQGTGACWRSAREQPDPRPKTSRRVAGVGCVLTAEVAVAPRDQLYNEAREKGIAGRSKMNKSELERAVGR